MLTDEEKKEAGITPEIEAKFSFDVSAPNRGSEPVETAKPPEEPPKEEPKKEEAAAPPANQEPEKEKSKEEPKEDTSKETSGHFSKSAVIRQKLKELKELRAKVLEKAEAAKDDAGVKAVHETKAQELSEEEQRINKELAEAYFTKMKEAVPNDDNREKLIAYANKYTPILNEKAPEFADWFSEQPRHFEALYGLYYCFASKKMTVDDFLDKTDYDKKEFVNNLLKAWDDEKAKEKEPPPETSQKNEEPKKEEPKKEETANGKPLPKVEGAAPAVTSEDDVNGLFEKRQSQRIQNYRNSQAR